MVYSVLQAPCGREGCNGASGVALFRCLSCFGEAGAFGEEDEDAADATAGPTDESAAGMCDSDVFRISIAHDSNCFTILPGISTPLRACRVGTCRKREGGSGGGYHFALPLHGLFVMLVSTARRCLLSPAT